MTDVTIHRTRTDDCADLPGLSPSPLPEPIVRPPWVLPYPSDEAWQDPDTVRRRAHPSIHTRPQPDCALCPPVGCPCGVDYCPDLAAHVAAHRCAEVTLLERCA